MDTSNPAEYLNFLGDTITAHYDDLVKERGQLYYTSVDNISEDGTEDEEEEKEEEAKSMCRVFILSIVLQFLLLTTTTKLQHTLGEQVEKSKSRQPRRRKSSNTSFIGSTSLLINSTEEEIPSLSSKSSPIPSKGHPMSGPHGKINFFLLQEAARMDLTRTMEYLTDGLMSCNKSIFMGANQDNFMHLTAHLRCPSELSHAHFFNIPMKYSFLDVVRYKKNPSNPTRYTWDSKVAQEKNAPLSSFARLVLKPNSATSINMKKAVWEDDITLIDHLLREVSTLVKHLDTCIHEARSIHQDLVFILWNERSTKNSTDKAVIFDDHLTMLRTIIHNSYECKFLNRVSITSDIKFQDFAIVKEFHALRETITDEEKDDSDNSFRSQCEEYFTAFNKTEYTYNVFEEFLVSEPKEKTKRKRVLSLNDNVENFYAAVEVIHFFLVRTIPQ